MGRLSSQFFRVQSFARLVSEDSAVDKPGSENVVDVSLLEDSDIIWSHQRLNFYPSDADQPDWKPFSMQSPYLRSQYSRWHWLVYKNGSVGSLAIC